MADNKIFFSIEERYPEDSNCGINSIAVLIMLDEDFCDNYSCDPEELVLDLGSADIDYLVDRYLAYYGLKTDEDLKQQGSLEVELKVKNCFNFVDLKGDSKVTIHFI